MMKPSYFTTPRTMSEAVFLLNCDPIERPEPCADQHAYPVVIAILAVLCVAGVVSVMVSL